LIAPLSAFERCIGEIFNLGTDTAITTAEGIRIVEELVGKPARIARQPRRAGDQSRTHANIAKARRILGYNPPTAPREGLTQTVAWYREQL
jgi:nucleoside-diphosphate-sugar epimerase